MRKILVLICAVALLSGCFANTNRVKQLELQWMGQQVTALANDNKTVQTELSDFGHGTKGSWNVSSFNEANDAVAELIEEYMEDGTLDETELEDIRSQDRQNLSTYMTAQQEVKDSRANTALTAAQLKERGDLLAAQLLDMADFTEKEKAAQIKLWKSAATQGVSLLSSLPKDKPTDTPDTPEDTDVPEGTGNIPDGTTEH